MPAFTDGYFFRRMNMEGVHIRIALTDSDIVGFYMLVLMGVPKIHLLAVDEVFRGRGVGKMLMVDALDNVRTGEVELSVRPWNSAMRGLCERMGFKEIGLRKGGYLGEPLVDYILNLKS
jgi:ribosomal protein S18 acetylase RimI-like enzyme